MKIISEGKILIPRHSLQKFAKFLKESSMKNIDEQFISTNGGVLNYNNIARVLLQEKNFEDSLRITKVILKILEKKMLSEKEPEKAVPKFYDMLCSAYLNYIIGFYFSNEEREKIDLAIRNFKKIASKHLPKSHETCKIFVRVLSSIQKSEPIDLDLLHMHDQPSQPLSTQRSMNSQMGNPNSSTLTGTPNPSVVGSPLGLHQNPFNLSYNGSMSSSTNNPQTLPLNLQEPKTSTMEFIEKKRKPSNGFQNSQQTFTSPKNSNIRIKANKGIEHTSSTAMLKGYFNSSGPIDLDMSENSKKLIRTFSNNSTKVKTSKPRDTSAINLKEDSEMNLGLSVPGQQAAQITDLVKVTIERVKELKKDISASEAKAIKKNEKLEKTIEEMNSNIKSLIASQNNLLMKLEKVEKEVSEIKIVTKRITMVTSSSNIAKKGGSQVSMESQRLPLETINESIGSDFQIDLSPIIDQKFPESSSQSDFVEEKDRKRGSISNQPKTPSWSNLQYDSSVPIPGDGGLSLNGSPTSIQSMNTNELSIEEFQVSHIVQLIKKEVEQKQPLVLHRYSVQNDLSVYQISMMVSTDPKNGNLVINLSPRLVQTSPSLPSSPGPKDIEMAGETIDEDTLLFILKNIDTQDVMPSHLTMMSLCNGMDILQFIFFPYVKLVISNEGNGRKKAQIEINPKPASLLPDFSHKFLDIEGFVYVLYYGENRIGILVIPDEMSFTLRVDLIIESPVLMKQIFNPREIGAQYRFGKNLISVNQIYQEQSSFASVQKIFDSSEADSRTRDIKSTNIVNPKLLKKLTVETLDTLVLFLKGNKLESVHSLDTRMQIKMFWKLDHFPPKSPSEQNGFRGVFVVEKYLQKKISLIVCEKIKPLENGQNLLSSEINKSIGSSSSLKDEGNPNISSKVACGCKEIEYGFIKETFGVVMSNLSKTEKLLIMDLIGQSVMLGISSKNNFKKQVGGVIVHEHEIIERKWEGDESIRFRFGTMPDKKHKGVATVVYMAGLPRFIRLVNQLSGVGVLFMVNPNKWRRSRDSEEFCLLKALEDFGWSILTKMFEDQEDLSVDCKDFLDFSKFVSIADLETCLSLQNLKQFLEKPKTIIRLKSSQKD